MDKPAGQVREDRFMNLILGLSRGVLLFPASIFLGRR